MGKRIAVLVSNDLNHDQRVLKTCETLASLGWEPYIIGREMRDSAELQIPFKGHRVRLPFERGFGFYAALQLALVRTLSGQSFDAIWSNDLDTLLPGYLVSRSKKIPLVYDSHEYFTEAAGLTGRPFQRGVWLMLERVLFPRVRSVITVNHGIAEAYADRYPTALGGTPFVVRNMPRQQVPAVAERAKWRSRLGVSESQSLLILQGAFLDKDRGVKLAVDTLRLHPSWSLVVVGAGSEWEWAKDQVDSLSGRLICLPKMAFEELRILTASADIGLSLDQGNHGNYWMSLPNKLFDYIHAGIPVVASPMPEVAKVVNHYGVGSVVESMDVDGIGRAIQHVLQPDAADWKNRCQQAALELNWEAEESQVRAALIQAEKP